MIFTPVGRLKSCIASDMLQKIMHSIDFAAGMFPKIMHSALFVTSCASQASSLCKNFRKLPGDNVFLLKGPSHLCDGPCSMNQLDPFLFRFSDLFADLEIFVI